MLAKIASSLARIGGIETRELTKRALLTSVSHLPGSYLPFGTAHIFQQQLRASSTVSARPLTNSISKYSTSRSFHQSSLTRCAPKTGNSHQNPMSADPAQGALQRLLGATYVLDTRLKLSMGAFLLPSLFMSGLWLALRLFEKKDALQWLDDHCTASLRNIQEGRYYTLLTSCFGAHGDIAASGLAEACTFLLFGGNLLRSFGFRSVFLMYMAGHVLTASAFLGFNYLQYADIVKYQKGENTAYTPRRDRRALVLAIARQTNESNPLFAKLAEEKQRNLIRMPEPEFLEHAKKYYLERPAVSIGGGLFLSLLGLRLHFLGFIPVPYIPIPVVAFTPIQVWTAMSTFTDYSNEDLILGTAPLLLAPFFAALALPRAQLIKHLPVELIDQMKMPKWIPRHLPPPPAAELHRAAEEAAELAKRLHLPTSPISPQQIEAMRKRNAKFQKSNK